MFIISNDLLNDKGYTFFDRQEGKKNPSPKRREFFEALPLALTGGFSLFLAFYAGLLVMLAFAHFLENAAAGALPLKPFERTFQGLIFADTNLGHCYPSPRSIQWPAEISLTSENHLALYSQSVSESRFFENSMPEGVTGYDPAKQSGHFITHLRTAKDMKMQVGNRLAGILTAVANNAISVFQILLRGNDPDSAKAFSKFTVVRKIRFIQGSKMLLRNDKDMNRRLGINVTERVDIIIFVDFGGRDFTLHDFTKEAVFHQFSIPFRIHL